MVSNVNSKNAPLYNSYLQEDLYRMDMPIAVGLIVFTLTYLCHFPAIVIARPEVYTDIVYQEVTENSDATLSCTTTGVPLPTIMWTNRLGDILENSSK